MPAIPFTSNYQDLSSDRGFQFRFNCEKCGNGYVSTFRTNQIGRAGALAQAAAGLLGGFFGRAAQTADSLQRMAAGPQHDAALRDAVGEVSPMFRQCTRCGNWVCEPVCWNAHAGLCESCAPDLEAETAAAKAQAGRDQAVAKARQAGTDCLKCGARAQDGRFCGECGAALNAKRVCVSCGTEADGSPKFCPECGKAFEGSM